MPTSSFKADSSLLASKADQRYELAISTITRSEFLKENLWNTVKRRMRNRSEIISYFIKV